MAVKDFKNVRDRYVPDYDRLCEMVIAYRTLDLSIVLTSGSYDIIHEGHMDCLEAVKALGDILIVAVDSDNKVRERKQKDEYTLRPFFSQDVRIRQLCGQRPVDLVTLKDVGQEKWYLIKLIRPDVLQATQGTYTEQQIEELKGICGDVVVQVPFATTEILAKEPPVS